MTSLDLTREWLNTVLRPYPARERIVSEMIDILSTRRTLSVKTDAFTYNTGQTALLLLLHGTLPISYRGATYHIPLHVWIPHDYPRNAPMVFVVPTKEMGVRKGREVEPGGRVKEDVVEGWWNGWESKSIEVLLRHLAGIFSATPPVFARPPETTTPARPNVQNGQSGMSPQMTGASTHPAAGPSSQPPPPPARPFNQSQPQPQPSTDFLPQYHSAPTPPPHPYPYQSSHMTHSHQSSSFYPEPNSNVLQSQPPSGQPPIPHRPHIVTPRQGSLPPSSHIEGPGVPQRPYITAPMPQGDTPRTPPRPISVGYHGHGPNQGYPGERHGSPAPDSPKGQMGYQPMHYPPQSSSGHPSNGYQQPPRPAQPNSDPNQAYDGHAPRPTQQPQYQGQQQHTPLPQSAQPPQSTSTHPNTAPQSNFPPPDLLSSAENDTDTYPSSSPSTSTAPPLSPPPSPHPLHSYTSTPFSSPT